MLYDVFISYASSDLYYAEVLYRKLTALKLNVWFDKARLKPGFKWYEKIYEACNNCKIVIPILSANWENSEWTKFETYGFDLIIPIFYNSKLDQVLLTPPLRRYQIIKLDFNDNSASWEELFQSVRDYLATSIVEKSTRISHLRYRPNSCFVGRQRDLIAIHESFFRPPSPDYTQGTIQVIVAEGGMGKTTLARQYAEQFWRLYPEMYWIDARENIEVSFAELAMILFPDLPVDTKQSIAAKKAIDELNEPKLRLLVIDDAIEEEAILNWIPKTGGCHCLITSRFTVWSSEIITYKISILDPDSACELILKRSRRRLTDENRSSLMQIIETVEGLPLALELVAAFIQQEGKNFTFEKYIDLYHNNKKEILSKRVRGSTEYPTSLFFTWNTTIQKLTPIAKLLLRSSGFLSTEPIPLNLFLENSKALTNHYNEIYKNDLVGMNESTYSEFEIREAWKELLSYSIAHHIYDNSKIDNGISDKKRVQLFSIHQLIRTIERISTEKANVDIWQKFLTSCIVEYIPLNAHYSTNWFILDIIEPHARHLFENSLNFDKRKMSQLTFKLSKYYFGRARYSESLRFDKTTIELETEFLPKNSEELVERYINLGETQRMCHQVDNAKSSFYKAISIRKKNNGNYHPKVAECYNYLALAYENENTSKSITKARNLLQKANNIFEENSHALKAKKESHLYDAWIKTLTNLARHVNKLNKTDEAISLINKALEMTKDADKGFASNATNILLQVKGSFLYDLGRYEDAIIVLKKSAEECKNNIGADHPNMIHINDALAKTFLKLDYILKAGLLYTETIKICYKIPEQKEKIIHFSNVIINIVADLLKNSHKIDAKKCKMEYLKALDKMNDLSPSHKRLLALDLYAIQEYDYSERLLSEVLDANFEISGTLCNLAAICLVTNRSIEAQKHIIKAWENRSDVPKHVLASIIWFKVLFGYLYGRSVKPDLGKLKILIKEDRILTKWNIQPVLDCLRSQLTDSQHSFLTALDEALNFKTKKGLLDNFNQWKEA